MPVDLDPAQCRAAGPSTVYPVPLRTGCGSRATGFYLSPWRSDGSSALLSHSPFLPWGAGEGISLSPGSWPSLGSGMFPRTEEPWESDSGTVQKSPRETLLRCNPHLEPGAGRSGSGGFLRLGHIVAPTGLWSFLWLNDISLCLGHTSSGR